MLGNQPKDSYHISYVRNKLSRRVKVTEVSTVMCM